MLNWEIAQFSNFSGSKLFPAVTSNKQGTIDVVRDSCRTTKIFFYIRCSWYKSSKSGDLVIVTDPSPTILSSSALQLVYLVKDELHNQSANVAFFQTFFNSLAYKKTNWLHHCSRVTWIVGLTSFWITYSQIYFQISSNFPNFSQISLQNLHFLPARLAELEFVSAVSAGGSVKFLPAV